MPNQKLKNQSRPPIVNKDWVMRMHTHGGTYWRDSIWNTKQEAEIAAKRWESSRYGAYATIYQRTWRKVVDG